MLMPEISITNIHRKFFTDNTFPVCVYLGSCGGYQEGNFTCKKDIATY